MNSVLRRREQQVGRLCSRAVVVVPEGGKLAVDAPLGGLKMIATNDQVAPAARSELVEIGPL